MRVPTSVLLAVLAAAGLLALAPALVRRYDATERLVAERALSTARVLQRRRRRRTVPGRRPVNPPRARRLTIRAGVGSHSDTAADAAAFNDTSSPVSAVPASAMPSSAMPSSAVPSSAVPSSAVPSSGSAVPSSGSAVPARRGARLRLVAPGGTRQRRQQPRRHTPAVIRRRRVFAALLLLNLVELIGVLVVGPGFWISFAVTALLLAVYLVHLRNRAVIERRRRRQRAREAAWLAARQAEVRREQARRAAARREAQRRLAAQREVVRRAAMGLDRPRDLPAAASGGVGGSVSYRRTGGLRGRAYEAGRAPETGRGHDTGRS
ncbi:hypothetical protein O7632_28995 [Solwaraspora sp. WMMD406]|uniref:hypothetical protein n=1 Tax=Solwaraspora sp. WMMD406 TaxID=3016095 RepID=UPI0024180E4A|nr:hypothetical protein [Solwaraspora sp. WMMD406]MDG4768097.1 hypothetical protein [Solwaraspora sp. WMMD406]